jgi:NADH-quinone oxidoreductase subunit L
VGTVSSLFAACGWPQRDIARLAHSTISQVSYMFLGGGPGDVAGPCSLSSHAFFKALLFLAGDASSRAARKNTTSLHGLSRRSLPGVFLLFLAGAISWPPSPFQRVLQRDRILLALFNPRRELSVPGSIGELTAFLTALYTFRLFFLVFGSARHRSAEVLPSGARALRPCRNSWLGFYGPGFSILAAGALNLPGLFLGGMAGPSLGRGCPAERRRSNPPGVEAAVMAVSGFLSVAAAVGNIPLPPRPLPEAATLSVKG